MPWQYILLSHIILPALALKPLWMACMPLCACIMLYLVHCWKVMPFQYMYAVWLPPADECERPCCAEKNNIQNARKPNYLFSLPVAHCSSLNLFRPLLLSPPCHAGLQTELEVSWEPQAFAVFFIVSTLYQHLHQIYPVLWVVQSHTINRLTLKTHSFQNR